MVTNALSSDVAIHVFKYRIEIGDMISQQGNRLAVSKVVAARLIAV